MEPTPRGHGDCSDAPCCKLRPRLGRMEWLMRGKPSVLGLISGAVAGLGTVTAASGYILPWQGA